MSKKFFDYGPFTDALADGDVLIGVDVSDTTQSAQGSTKRVTVAQVKAAAPVQSVNGETGAVVLAVSDLANDAGYVTRLGALLVDFFAISGNITLDSTHNGRTGYITGNAVITLPDHAASAAGYGVELVHDTPATHTVTVAPAGTDTVRGSLTTITGDAAVVRTPTAGQWGTIGDVSA